MKNRFLSTVIQLWLLFLAALAGANPGDPDNTFRQQGVIDQPITAVAVDSHGFIWIGGRFSNVYGQGYPYLAVLNPDGTLNTHFVSASLFSIGVVHALDVDDGDNVYVGGQYGIGRLVFVPNNQSWTVDTAFQTQASQVVRRCDSVAVERGFGQPAQAIYVAGNVSYTNGNVVVGNVACLYNNGTLNLGFQMPEAYSGEDVVQIRYLPPATCGINTLSTGYLLLSGSFGSLMLQGSGLIELADADFIQTSCTAMRSQGAQCSCPSAHGELVRGGFFHAGYFPNSDTFTPFHLERSGGNDPTWFHSVSDSNVGVDAGSGISAIEALDGGDLVIAGLFTQVAGSFVGNFAHLLPNGTVDTTFNNNVGFPVYAMAKQTDGKYILAGETGFTPEGGSVTRRLGVPATQLVSFPSQPVNTTVFANDPACLSVSLDASPEPSLMWYRNNNPLTNETGVSICFSGAVAGDEADYFLRATTFCGVTGFVDSKPAHLTVIPAPAPAPNDMFSNAFTLGGLAAVGTSYIRSATQEAGEPDHAGSSGGRSVWWNWTSPVNGTVVLDVSGSDFDAALAVYTGSDPAALTLITNNCHLVCSDGCACEGLLSNITFTAATRVTYRIAVGGSPPPGSLGNVLLRLNPIVFIPLSLTFSNGFTMQVSGPAGGSAVLETTGTLNPPAWYPIATNPFLGGTITLTDARLQTNTIISIALDFSKPQRRAT